MSPEQASGKPVTNRSDLYSFGAVLFTLLVGHPPFQGRSTLDLMHKHRYAQFDPPQRLVPDIPFDLDRIVCGLLDKDPAQRPANGLVLLRQFETFRNKVHRREQRTIVTNKPHETQAADEEGADEEGEELHLDNPGPATLMSQLVRKELTAQQRGGPVMRWINRPMVLVPLFIVCVGLIIWGIWFQPKTTETVTPLEPVSKLESLYQQGQHLYRTGYHREARNHWQNMVLAFKNVKGLPEADRKWVDEAERSLREKPDLPTKDDDDEQWKLVEMALAEATVLAATKPKEAEERRRAIAILYWYDPQMSRKIAERIKRDSGE